MERPSDLPEFDAPPLDEVVFSTQFEPCPGYSQIRALEVWNLFREKYPGYAEQPPIQPVFEMFGDALSQPSFNFSVNTGPSHPRYWFLSEQGEQLVQFQPDRFLHNWRKVGDRTNAYPRFESMIVEYQQQLEALFGYFETLLPVELSGFQQAINQTEVTYINIIPLPKRPGLFDMAEWVRLINPDRPVQSDAANIGFFRTLHVGEAPIGRLHCQIGAARLATGAEVIRIELTARGIPQGQNISDAIDFLRFGREIIVNTFADITTDSAHRAWKRLK